MFKPIQKFNKFHLLIAALILYLLWHFFLQTWVWQLIFAQKTNTMLQNQPLDIHISLLPDTRPQIIRLGDYDIEIKIRAEAEIIARVIYIDFYDNHFQLGKKSRTMRMRDVYNTVSPLDISIVTGLSAVDGNWQKFNIKHEYRTLFWQYTSQNQPIYRYQDFNNLHILPATNAIRRGIDTLQKGQIIQLKGYLIDWRELGEFSAYPFETAKEIGQLADFKLGGQTSGLCYYLYVTELSVNGYIYN